MLLLDVDRQCAGRLYSIGVEQNAVLLADGADFRNRLDRADFVVRIHDRHQGRVLADRRFQFLRPYESISVDVQIGDGKALFFQRCAGMKHRMMLKFGCDDVLLPLFGKLMGNPFDRPVVRFASARCKKDLVGFGVQAGRDVCAGQFQVLFGLPAHGI